MVIYGICFICNVENKNKKNALKNNQGETLQVDEFNYLTLGSMI